VDNRQREPKYLEDALDAIQAGRPITKASTAQWGCTVKYRKGPEK